LWLALCGWGTDQFSLSSPTADFLVWYYDYLLSEVSESYGQDWEFTIDPDNITEEQEKETEEGDKEREGFIRDCIENQIATWTVQRINGKNTIKIPTNDHVKIVYDLINDIAARRMEIHNTKTKGSDSNPDADSSLDDMVKEITGRKEADLK
jgi:hypothetical protein